MASFTPSTIGINSEILALLEMISRKQGELSAQGRNIHDELSIESIAAVDAVHFSTKLEGNSLSRDQVTEALRSGKVKASARQLQEVLNYSRVRKKVRDWSLKRKPFGGQWVLEHHAEVLRGIVKGKLRGHFREAQCVIQDSSTRAIVYIAPEWPDVPLLIKQLLLWLRRQRLDGASPLLLAAQFHFEFVTIHPFMDGNGRLARLLTNGILVAGGYDVEHYAALEKQHERDRAGYYQVLRSLQFGNFYDIPRAHDIRTWVIYWLKCLQATYDEALARMHGASHAVGSAFPPFLDIRLQKCESIFRRHQKLRASDYADLLGLGRTQAVADLNQLVEAGVLERIGGGRSTVYRIKRTEP